MSLGAHASVIPYVRVLRMAYAGRVSVAATNRTHCVFARHHCVFAMRFFWCIKQENCATDSNTRSSWHAILSRVLCYLYPRQCLHYVIDVAPMHLALLFHSPGTISRSVMRESFVSQEPNCAVFQQNYKH